MFSPKSWSVVVVDVFLESMWAGLEKAIPLDRSVGADVSACAFFEEVVSSSAREVVEVECGCRRVTVLTSAYSGRLRSKAGY